MSDKLSRRQFVTGLGALAALSAMRADTFGQTQQLYPPTDLSYFKKPITPGPAPVSSAMAGTTGAMTL